MICRNCGQEIPDNTKFCSRCGANLFDGMPQQQYAAPPPQPQYTAPPQQPQFSAQQLRMSTYDGTVFETFIAALIASLIISLTAGIATPWGMCYFYKFVLSHIIIDGKRLTFDGEGGQLFGNWIKWFLLMAVTFGIYSFWVYPKMFDWMAKHTHFAN